MQPPTSTQKRQLFARKAIAPFQRNAGAGGQEKNGISACKAERTASYAEFSLDRSVGDSAPREITYHLAFNQRVPALDGDSVPPLILGHVSCGVRACNCNRRGCLPAATSS